MWRLLHALSLGLLLCSAGASADSAQVLAADHHVSGAAHTRVETRWVLDAPVHAGDYFELARPLPSGTALESADVSPMRDSAHRISAVVARRDLPREIRLSTQLDDKEARELPLASPNEAALERLRFAVQLHTKLRNAQTVRHLGIRTAAHMSRRERRHADQLLDGAHAHRRVGALYFQSHDGPVEVLPGSGEKRRGVLRVAVALLFVALLGAGLARLKQAKQRMRDERANAYLRQALPKSNHELPSLEEG